jgi:hypothetical protein
MHRLLRILLLIASTLLALAAAQPAHAALGGSENEIAGESTLLRARSRVESPGLHGNTHLLTLPRSRVRQFADPSGAVFAVCWRGSAHPDLSILLGSHYSTYLAERASARRRGARVLRLSASDGMIVEQFGHVGYLGGAAYLPARFPAGFAPADIDCGAAHE